MSLSRKMLLSMSAVMLLFAAISVSFVYAITGHMGLDNDMRVVLAANLLGVMLLSFLVCLVLIYKQISSFVVPFRNLSKYFHSISNEGFNLGSYNANASHIELDDLTRDLNTLIRNVSTFMESVRFGADRVSDLSGACSDMLDIVDFDSKTVGRRLQLLYDYVKQTSDQSDEFALKFKKVEEAQKAIEHTIIDAKNSMKVLNDVSASLRGNSKIFYIPKS